MRTEWQNEFKLLSIVISTKYMAVLFLFLPSFTWSSVVGVFKSTDFFLPSTSRCYVLLLSCCVSRSVVPDSLRTLWLGSPLGCFVSMDFSSKDPGVDCHFLLQDLPTQGFRTRFRGTEGRFFTDWATREAHALYWQIYSILVNPNLTSNRRLIFSSHLYIGHIT